MFKKTHRALSLIIATVLAIATPLTALASEGSSFGRPVPEGKRVTFALPKNDCYLEEENSFGSGRIEYGADVPDTISASDLKFTLTNAPATYTRSPNAYHFTVSEGFAVQFGQDTPVGGGLGGTYLKVGDNQYGQYVSLAYGNFAKSWVPERTDNFSKDDYSEYMVLRLRNAEDIQITVTFSYESSPVPKTFEPSTQTLPIESFNADISAAITGITPSSWAAESVKKARELGFVTRATNWAFQSATTRGEFCRLAVSFLDSYGYDISGVTPKIFADTDDRYIGIAAALKITSGTDTAKNLFSPDRNLTREEAAAMLRNVMNVIGVKYDTTAVKWTDAKNISSWAAEAANVMYNAKVMGGTSTTALVFDPKSPYTHETSIATLVNLWNFVKK
ncbi:hypothetical protein FACS18949_06960 [Clostridia bacterium]|nr:hypothetical protein FACS189425_05470 [Clostridia bacterium]GHV33323.1 hypothetical protein FACS18949_06960 [Clostridia bacterium]